MVYARQVDGKTLTFGVSGKLIMNALVMYDSETDSLWSQFLGEAVDGALSGAGLELLPALLTPWAAWRDEHPDTLYLEPDGFPIDPYNDYYLRGTAGILGESNVDVRLPTKALVVGIEVEGGHKAYPFPDLAGSGVVNDTFRGRDLVLAMNADTAAAGVFDRSLDGRTLTFDQSESQRSMVDRETGSVWDKATGEATGGELLGSRLRRVEFMASFWFAWSDFHPETELYAP